ncbi:MAG: RHS repeat-associated core domain-containing protein [Planctomycetota bacterium]
MKRTIALFLAAGLTLCTAALAAPRVDIDPISASPVCERTDLVLGEGPGALHVVRRWAGDTWLTTLDAALHVDGDEAWVLTLDAQALELVRDGAAWVTVSGDPLRVTTTDQGYRLEDLARGDVLWFDALGTPLALERAGGRLEFEPAGDGIGGVQGVWGRLTVERDRAGRLTQLRAPGADVVYRYQGEALSSVTGPLGDEVYSYAEGRLAQVGATQVRYDAQGRACALEGGRAPLDVTYGEDPAWTVVAEVRRSGERETLRYSEAQRQLVVEGAQGRTETRFDARLRLVRVEREGAVLLRRAFDRLERLIALETPEGVTQWSYEGAARQPARVILPSGAELRFVRNDAGQVTLREGPRGAERFAYDAWGALIKHQDARGVVTSYQRDARGYVVGAARAGQVTRLERDQDGQVQRIVTPDGRETEFVAKGRSALVRDQRGLVYAASYDEAGRPLAWRDASGRTLRYEYDGRGLLTRAADEEGELLRCSYGERGELVAYSDAQGNTVRYERPEPGVLVVHDPSAGDATLRFDAQGQLVSETRGDVTIRYRYDRRGRLVERQTPEGREELDYDTRGRLVRWRNAETTLTYRYAPDGQLAELHNQALGTTIRYAYDAHGQRRSAELPWGETRYERDAQGRLTALVADGARVEFELLPDGRRAQVRYPNGAVTSFDYDKERLTESVTRQGDALLERHAYAYDAAGHVVSHTAGERTVRYTYDARGQLLAAEGAERLDYAWDAQGNRVADAVDGVQRDFELGAGNRVVGQGEETLHYDARGALVRREGPDGETRYRYDADGHLLEATGPAGSVRYGYAPDGTRLWREDAQGRVFELNDGTHVLGVRVDGEWTTRYLHGEQVDDLLLAQREDGSYAYHTDLVGSVTAISGPEGELAARYAYGPFGEDRGAQGAAAAWNPWRYTARSLDSTTGLYDCRARSYDADLGRFLTPDPSGRLGGVNLYAYALNDPVRFNDPWGLEATPGRGAPTTADQPNVFERGLNALDEAAATHLNPMDRGKYELLRGAGNYVGDTVMGVADLFKKQTWVDLGEAIAAIKEDPAILKEVARQIGDGTVDKFEEYVDAWKNDRWKALRMTGYGAAAVGTAAIGSIKAIQAITAAAKAVKASKAAKRAAEGSGRPGRPDRAARGRAGTAANAGRGRGGRRHRGRRGPGGQDRAAGPPRRQGGPRGPLRGQADDFAASSSDRTAPGSTRPPRRGAPTTRFSAATRAS